MAKVRRTLRRVSSIGHSQAVSICAWPVSATAPCGGKRAFSRRSSATSQASASAIEARASSVSGVGG